MPFTLLAGAATPVPPADVGVLRAALAAIGGRDHYCIPFALSQPPFASIRREMADYAADAAQPAPTAAQRAAALREMMGSGWTSDARTPLDAATRRLVQDAGAKIAERGDPSPMPAEDVGELNVTDAVDSPDAAGSGAAADADAGSAEPATGRHMVSAATVPIDHGRLDHAWLAPGQRLSDDCHFPSASLSAVVRDGDIAFVSVGLVWGSLAGVGETWAFRREGTRWRRIAIRHEWVA